MSMLKRAATSITLLAALVAVAGCGVNTLRVEYAGNVAAQSTVVVAASRVFIESVRRARRDTVIELVSADPACAQIIAPIRAVPLFDRAPAPGWFCVPEGEARSPRDISFSNELIVDRLGPTLGVIDSLASYSSALTDIVSDVPADPAGDIAKALETLRTSEAAFRAILNAGSPQTPAEDDPRVASVLGFIRFLSQLSAERDQVERLRQVVRAEPHGAQPLIATLEEQLRGWQQTLVFEAAAQQAANQVLVRSLLARPDLNPAARRAVLTAYFEREDARQKLLLLYPALQSLLDVLQVTDSNLRRILRERPNLTREERMRIAEINRVRVLRALESVTAIVTSFRG